MNTIQSKTHHILRLFLSACLIGAISHSNKLFAASTENFDDNAKNAAKWGTDVVKGHGVLTERNQRLEYTCATATVEDSSDRPWKLTRFPYNADWQIQVDTFNSTTPMLTQNFQVNSMGIDLFGKTSGESVFTELYSSALGSPPARIGFAAGLSANDIDVGSADSSTVEVTVGAVRMEFNSVTKVITVLYETNVNDGYQWVEYGSFGIAGSGGTHGDADWGMTDTNQFSAYVYGFSIGSSITSGQMYVDNFVENGGVASSGGVFPEPVGSFKFKFPTNNVLLTRILSLIGNFRGLFPFPSATRNFNVDVAEDESGKLAVMGTVDGLQENGVPLLSENIGTIKTVDGQPTVKLKGSFNGTIDGVPATVSGTATGPVNFTDVGGGTNGFAATTSYRSKIGGVPVSVKNMPIQFIPESDTLENVRQDWTVQLDISKKDINGKERTVASAELLLPNGDTVMYKEKIVKYSVTRGYSISFTRGTNITANPPRLDKKSSIAIKGMTLIQQGADWVPTGGIITYKLLGQKGTANLLDFETP